MYEREYFFIIPIGEHIMAIDLSSVEGLTEEQIAAMAAYVASLAPGPAIPDEEYLRGDGDPTHGGELFRINCAMCHNAVGAGGALTEGKFAPSLAGVSAKHTYEAMVTGPHEGSSALLIGLVDRYFLSPALS